MAQSETIGKLAEALSKAQGAMRPASKDKDNPYFKSKYADLASIWDAVRKPLSDNGLSVIQTLLNPESGLGIIVVTTLAHSSGEWMNSYLQLTPSKGDPQGVGAAITYGRRFGLAAITGMCSDDEDDDGNSNSDQGKKPVAALANQTYATKPVMQAVPKAPVQEKTPAVVCESCSKSITDGIDSKGKAFDAAKMMSISEKAFKQKLCYDCFIKVKAEKEQVAEVFGLPNVSMEAVG